MTLAGAADAAPAAAAVAIPGAVLLDLEVVKAATNNFAMAREIGCGGFGKVYRADRMASLTQVAWPVQELAVKLASAGLELGDVSTEVKILQACEHPHLLPLFGYCLDAVAMVAGDSEHQLIMRGKVSSSEIKRVQDPP
jgi:hypothetical protein